MADINIANLPDSPLPILDGDFIHTSQVGTDYKIVMTDLADRFNLVDIFSMVQTTTPTSGNFVPISTSGTLDGNRRVSLFNMGKLYQANEFFVTSGTIDITDEIMWREAGADELQQTTFTNVQDLITDWPSLTNSTTGATDDTLGIFDDSTSEIRRITMGNVRIFSSNPTSFNTITTPAPGDIINVWDISASSGLEQSQITFANLSASITPDLTSLVTITTDQTISGTKTFSSASGILTDKINEATAGIGVTIEGVHLLDNDIEAVVNVKATGYVEGKFRGTGGIVNGTLIAHADVLKQGSLSTHSGSNSATFDTVLENQTLNALVIEGDDSSPTIILPDGNGSTRLGVANRRYRDISVIEVYANNITMPLSTDFPSPEARLSSNFYLDDQLMTEVVAGQVFIDRQKLPTANSTDPSLGADNGVVGLASIDDISTSSARVLTLQNFNGAQKTIPQSTKVSVTILSQTFDQQLSVIVTGFQFVLGNMLITSCTVEWKTTFDGVPLELQRAEFNISLESIGLRKYGDGFSRSSESFSCTGTPIIDHTGEIRSIAVLINKSSGNTQRVTVLSDGSTGAPTHTGVHLIYMGVI